MPTIAQIRGMLLEEAVLHLLRSTGYKPVEKVNGTDPTLENGPAGMKVQGRGGSHQIDAIADFAVNQPFTYKQRLLVEAKCYQATKTVGIEVVRNAVGVLKDVSEYWVPDASSGISSHRYNYQYAVFSATEYTRGAQKYAFAHGIYLIPVANSTFLRPVVDAIRSVSEADFEVTADEDTAIELRDLRNQVRDGLKGVDDRPRRYSNEGFGTVIAQCREISGALLAVLGGSFPVFLVPASADALRQLEDNVFVRIRWDSNAWYIYHDNEKLFSFDLPNELFNLYADKGVLSASSALDLKESFMSDFHAIRTLNDGQVRLLRFRLDRNWINDIRNKIHESPRTR